MMDAPLASNCAKRTTSLLMALALLETLLGLSLFAIILLVHRPDEKLAKLSEL
ncbi:hypothetical protein V473_13235 [Sphingobium cupriresistens LL01]|uniref:Uncharacterized protein n=1 Tax=Sphingobium cupriresistens LL01 TaxID=1420583 RepID=A0A0J7XWG7_9SPHN|nr:hypothetical protein V473_13235 [Sphingobium cupriresistens LL01]